MSLLSLFKKKPQRALGLEINGRSIRWAEVSVGDTAFEIETHGRIDVAYTPWSQGTEAHQKMTKDFAPLKAYRDIPLVCVIPESLTHTAYLTLGIDEDEKSLAFMIERAIESYIVEHPLFVAAHTVCLYDIIQQDSATATIVITLYQTHTVAVLKEVFKKLGFTDISFTPLHDTLQALHTDHEPLLMISLAQSHTSLIQMVNTRLQGYAQVPFGAGDVMKHIRDVVGSDRAQRVYARYGMKSTHRDPSLYARIIQQALPVIEHAQHMIAAAGKDHTIIIAGEYADLPGLDTFIASQLRRAPLLLDVQQRFVSPDIRLPVIDAHDMLRFAPVLGAAIDYLESR